MTAHKPMPLHLVNEILLKVQWRFSVRARLTYTMNKWLIQNYLENYLEMIECVYGNCSVVCLGIILEHVLALLVLAFFLISISIKSAVQHIYINWFDIIESDAVNINCRVFPHFVYVCQEMAKVETKCGLSERNRATSCQTLSSSNAPSTTVVAPVGGFTSSEHDTNSLSLFSVGAYDEFEVCYVQSSHPFLIHLILPSIVCFFDNLQLLGYNLQMTMYHLNLGTLA